MKCKYCGFKLSPEDDICPSCRRLVENVKPDENAYRQGAQLSGTDNVFYASGSIPEIDRFDPAMGTGYTPDAAHDRQRSGRSAKNAKNAKNVKKKAKKRARKSRFNWARFWTAIICLAFIAVIAGFLLLKYTDRGQLILARAGRDANAPALWVYGQELLDQGYIERSIATFEAAYEKEPEGEDLYTHLSQLADAYEAGGYTAKAEAVYRKMCTEVDDTDPTAYKAVVRILQDQSRDMELADFLSLAYEKTGLTSFRRQREQMVPPTPATDLEAGTLKLERLVTLTAISDQDGSSYDIYYKLGEDGILPEDGQLFTEPILLTEGTHILRAVSVSDTMVSDELTVKYTIQLPVPNAPYPSLASGVYQGRQRIRLRYNENEYEQNSNDPLTKQITIYYTLDGQTPSSNSPKYSEDEPILLTVGKTTLKAVALNGYGKVSNILTKTYKIQSNTKIPKYFNTSDTFREYTVMETGINSFTAKMGQPLSEKDVEDSSVRGICKELTYAWGTARFVMTSDGYMLFNVLTSSSSVTGPRGVKTGMKLQDITALFRDMGQGYDQNGDRSLYHENEGTGKLYHISDTEDHLIYTYPVTEGGTMTFTVYLENQKAVRLGMVYSAF